MGKSLRCFIGILAVLKGRVGRGETRQRQDTDVSPALRVGRHKGRSMAQRPSRHTQEAAPRPALGPPRPAEVRPRAGDGDVTSQKCAPTAGSGRGLTGPGGGRTQPRQRGAHHTTPCLRARRHRASGCSLGRAGNVQPCPIRSRPTPRPDPVTIRHFRGTNSYLLG